MTTPLAHLQGRRLTAADVATLAAAVPPRPQTAASPSLTAITSGTERTGRVIWGVCNACEVLTPNRTYVPIISGAARNGDTEEHSYFEY
jgi:hypothetical protein